MTKATLVAGLSHAEMSGAQQGIRSAFSEQTRSLR